MLQFLSHQKGSSQTPDIASLVLQEKAHRYRAAEGTRVGPASEMAACQCLVAACTTALEVLPTTLHEDVALLVRTMRFGST